MDATDAFLYGLTRCKTFTRDEERELVKRMKAGDADAYNQLASSVLPFAFQLCAKKIPDIEEATAAATDAVLRALASFVPAKGRLTTYTWWSARSSVTRYHNARRIQAERMACVSLDEESICGESLKERIADPRAIIPGDDATTPERFVAYTEWLITRLTPREQDMIGRRQFGEKLKEIGAAHGVSKERARQILLEAKKRLRRIAEHNPMTEWEEPCEQRITA